MGAKKRPFYRVVVADSRMPRDGRFVETIGTYNPLREPSEIRIDEEKAIRWLKCGAQPSNAVRHLLLKSGVWKKYAEEKASLN
jgi:small subunit ribosomal protein S16